MAFIHDDFLLSNEPARQLYHGFAKDQPILDFHNHLSPTEIAGDRRFDDLYEMWLEGDHYKWRAMRWNGEPEELITGSEASNYDKFLAFARTVPNTLRNPLYHWTHLELKRYFGIDKLLSPETAEEIWHSANEQLQSSVDLTARGSIRASKVLGLCTTDDPCDTTEAHEAINADDCGFKAYPTFRPDAGFATHNPEAFNSWCDKLASQADMDITTLYDLHAALRKRHDDFHTLGARLSDHGMEVAYADFPTEAEAKTIFDKVRSGTAASRDEVGKFASDLMLHVGNLNAEKGWTQQMHLGPIRNNRPGLFRERGPDLGTDSMSDAPQTAALAAYLGRLDEDKMLPKTVLYNLNPAWNYPFATMAANFQDGSVPGKIQFGSGWWFLDQKEGMEWQINALSNCGLLSRFIGMLTDSRSFTSFARHEYFRRTLCNLIGADIDAGMVPDDYELVGGMVRNICYQNAKDFLGLEVG